MIKNYQLNINMNKRKLSKKTIKHKRNTQKRGLFGLRFGKSKRQKSQPPILADLQTEIDTPDCSEFNTFIEEALQIHNRTPELTALTNANIGFLCYLLSGKTITDNILPSSETELQENINSYFDDNELGKDYFTANKKLINTQLKYIDTERKVLLKKQKYNNIELERIKALVNRRDERGNSLMSEQEIQQMNNKLGQHYKEYPSDSQQEELFTQHPDRNMTIYQNQSIVQNTQILKYFCDILYDFITKQIKHNNEIDFVKQQLRELLKLDNTIPNNEIKRKRITRININNKYRKKITFMTDYVRANIFFKLQLIEETHPILQLKLCKDNGIIECLKAIARYYLNSEITQNNFDTTSTKPEYEPKSRSEYNPYGETNTNLTGGSKKTKKTFEKRHNKHRK
jgi:hypothetical protein